MALSLELKALGAAAAAGAFVVAASFGTAALVSSGKTSETPQATSAVSPPPTGAALAKEIIAGHDYFESSCAGCHGEDGDGGNDAPSLHGEDMTDAEIADTIKNGSGRMPPFAKIYNTVHTREIIEFIRTLK